MNRNPLPGLVVSLDGDATSTAVTNWNGVFTFQVTSGRHYTVSPPINGLISNWKFQNGAQQNSVDHPNLTQSVSNDDFTAATPQFTVAGIVVNTSGTPLVGLKVQLRFPAPLRQIQLIYQRMEQATTLLFRSLFKVITSLRLSQLPSAGLTTTASRLRK